MVLVYNKNGETTEPCSNKIARLLLKEDKATVKSYRPFTIQLKFNLDEMYKKFIEDKGDK